jgi:transposase-like protein
MALSQSVVSELLEAFRAGEGVDLIRESVRLVMQELIETEATQQIGAGRYERAETRVTDRNGSRARLVATQAGDVRLRIPKLRKGSFFPAILEPRRRIDQALYAVVMEAYVNGVSTRAVDDLVAALGIESGISKSEVSRICAGLDEQVEAFRSRPLHHTEFPYVFLDATYLHVRRTGQVTSMAVVVATGVTAIGGREVLGVDVGDSEDEVFWRGFLRTLKERGLAGVRLIISDQHTGLVAALGRVFQRVGHQRCRVHFARNLLALVPKSHKDMVAAVFRTIFAQPTAEARTGAGTPRHARGHLPNPLVRSHGQGALRGGQGRHLGQVTRGRPHLNRSGNVVHDHLARKPSALIVTARSHRQSNAPQLGKILRRCRLGAVRRKLPITARM